MKAFHHDVVIRLTITAVIAGTAWIQDWYSNRPRFEIEKNQLTLDALPTGQEQEVTYRIHNLTGNIMRIVGAESG